MFTFEVRPLDEVTARFWENGRQMDTAEFFTRSAKRRFETDNTIGLSLTEIAISKGEREAGEFDPEYGTFSDADRTAMAEDMPPEWIEEAAARSGQHKYAMSEEEYKASPFYDKRIPYAPDMTPTRARILKENRDRLDAEDKALAQETDGLGRTLLGFGAGMVASLPDPINLIPFSTGAKAATLGKAVKNAAIAGSVSNVAADAVIFPWARSYGEDVGASELLQDAIFGAVLGSGFGAFGYGMSKWMGKRQPGNVDGDAAGTAADAPQEPLLGHNTEALERVRGELLGQDRVNTGRMVDVVLRDIDQDVPLDVARNARDMGVPGPAFMPDGHPPIRTDAMIADGSRPYWGRMDIGEMLPLAEEFYAKTLATLPPVQARGGRTVFIRGHQGWGKLHGKTPDADKLKLLPYIDKILEDAEWVFTEPARRSAHAKTGITLHDLLAAVEYDGRILEVRLKVREAKDGKFFYDFFNESEPPTYRPKETPLDSTGASAASGSKGGESSEGGALRSKAFSRRQTGQVQGDSSVTHDVTLPQDNSGVNIEVQDITPDLTPEPLRQAAPPVTPEERAVVDKAMDFEAARLMEEGRVTDEEAAALKETAADLEAVNREEEAMLSVLECVVGALT